MGRLKREKRSAPQLTAKEIQRHMSPRPKAGGEQHEEQAEEKVEAAKGLRQ
jgi:hypothetical protein